MPRNIEKVSRRLITNVLKANGIDPATLKGAEKLYGAKGSMKKIQITREESKKIKERLSRGELVVLRPTIGKAARAWEFVDPKNVDIKAYHGHASKRPVKVGEVVERHFPEANPKALRVGKVLVAIQTKLGVMQKDLAARMSVGQGELSKWQRGLACPGIKTLPKIARFVEERPALIEFKEELLEAFKAIS